MGNMQMKQDQMGIQYEKSSGSGTIGDPYVQVVEVNASENIIGKTGGMQVVLSTEIITTATQAAYAANDAVLAAAGGVSELAGAARVAGGSGYIMGIRISTDKKSIVPALRIHFFNTSTPTIAADNATWKEMYADTTKRIGYFDLPAMTTAADAANSDMSRTFDFSMVIPFVCATGQTSLWFAIETLTAFTPSNSQKFTVKVNVMPN